MKSPSSPISPFALATDRSLDQYDQTARIVNAKLEGGQYGGNFEQLMTMVDAQQAMQFAMAEVDLAVKRRNSFTTKIVSEIR